MNFQAFSSLLILCVDPADGAVGPGGGSADVTGIAPDGDPVSFADNWSRNNWF